MAEVRKIQCPSCGSNSTYKLFDGSYKCNYCQGSFMVDEVRQQRPAVQNTQSGASGAITKKVILAVVAAFMILAMAMVGFLVTKGSTSYNAAGVDADVPAKPAVIANTMAFAGARSNVIWIVLKKPYARDSFYYELLAVDPKNSFINGEQLIGAPFGTHESVDPGQVFGNQFFKFGDLAYTILNDTALRAYDIYSGEQVLTNKSLSEKISGSVSSILKIEYSASEKRFKITTTAGDVLSFDPLAQAFLPAVMPKSEKEEPVTTELYLSDGLKHHLYLFTKRGDGFPIVSGSFVQESRLPGPEAPKANNVKDIFGNLHIEKVSEKNYFRAQPLLKDPRGNLLVLYKTDLSATAPVILESVSPQGKANWSLQDTSFLSIGKAFASEDLGCYYTYSDSTIIIGLDREERQYVAVDIATGKILWSFDPKAYIEKQAL